MLGDVRPDANLAADGAAGRPVPRSTSGVSTAILIKPPGAMRLPSGIETSTSAMEHVMPPTVTGRLVRLWSSTVADFPPRPLGQQPGPEIP